MDNDDPCHSGPEGGRILVDTSNSAECNLVEFQTIFHDWMPGGTPDEAAGLSVVSVDMHANENKKGHNTNKYKNTNLIVRRNQEFTISIKLSRPFNEHQDNVQVEFLIGTKPDVNKGTYNIVSIGKEKRDGRWKGRVVNTQDNEVAVGITPDSSCIVGRFRTFVVVVSDMGKQRTERNPDTDVYVLFNPWDPADQVYMEKDEDRQEYVLNDVGIIYNGDYDNVTSRSWNYGQFEQGVLDACLLVMDVGKVPLVFRGNATQVARQAAALMNVQNDNGVLVGNWSSDYSDGTAPTAWTGSPEILLKYARKGGTPVCFAQCWVFAGVLNTFVRCLGMPVRVITNYCSAHDNTGNLMTDIVLDEAGRVNKGKTKDSVWNYHCWNEVYMKRLDLPPQYSGWQVIDSTPQETSDGLYRCGPTSVNAIKEGEISYQFDARFVFAELNSDVIYYQSDKYGKRKVIYVDPTYVGKLVLTKKLNSSEYEDITSNYKYPEGTLEEREAMDLAESRGVPTRNNLAPAASGLDIEVQADVVKMGDNFKLTMNLKNLTTKKCTIHTTLTGCVVYYTGVISSFFKFDNDEVTVESLQTETLKIDVRAMEYMPYLVEQSNLMFVVYGRTDDLEVSLSKMKVVTLLPPDLTLRVIGTPQVGKDLMISVEFLNPFNYILENVQLRLDGPDLIQTKMKTYRQIFPGGTIKYKESIIPKALGKKTLMACLDCNTLRQVNNEVVIEVLNATDN
ncbi:coagulation factor XIII A chain-like [Paramisgurnus dabryanus]|uniref:coagulation factor XIII A chain-like n=1 Tax=Paramisgurnus dabryanus TaxID=90735 RepID=UPI003CCFD299